jgi:anti-sigma factor ChrR (cupin superfamily)
LIYNTYQLIGIYMISLQLHSDFAQRYVVDTNSLHWLPSPTPGIDRRMVERDGGEIARASTVVRYAAGSTFPSHRHDLGEEILVLEGSFSDAHGEYGAGTYIKNPPGSSHSPSTLVGCVLWVKLRHLDPADVVRTVVDTRQAAWHQGLVSGLTVLPLSEFGTTHTAMVRWAPQTFFNPHRHYGGEEIFVVDGVFEDEHGRYEKGTWIRSPHMSQHQPFSREGCTILVKTGHLPPQTA